MPTFIKPNKVDGAAGFSLRTLRNLKVAATGLIATVCLISIAGAQDRPFGETNAAQKRTPEEEMGLLLQLTPPDPARLFQFESEEKVRQRIREELKDIVHVEFPPSPETPPVFHPMPRLWPFLVATAAPGYVCYKRLWFEQKNSERYGWDFGVLQPGISAGMFYADLALLPVHWILDPCRWYDCSAGRCLPGEPVPLLWNPVFGK